MAIVVPICSSSKGNCTYVGDYSSGILVDMGCSFKALRQGLELNSLSIENVRAVFVTHEHTDHIKGIHQLTKRTDIPVFASNSVQNFLIENDLVFDGERVFSSTDGEIYIEDFHIKAFSTPHDSVGSVGYKIEFDNKKIGICTDLGSVTNEVRNALLGCEMVLLESNYDPELLRTNTVYPYYLKQRITGREGHLSNKNSAEFLCELIDNGATRIFLGHLSQENNTPNIARKTAEKFLKSIGAINGSDYILEVAPVMTCGVKMTV